MPLLGGRRLAATLALRTGFACGGVVSSLSVLYGVMTRRDCD
jgi:hypothetical protein